MGYVSRLAQQAFQKAPKPPALVIAQHPARLPLEESYGSLRRTRVLKQGDNVLSFFEPVGAK